MLSLKQNLHSYLRICSSVFWTLFIVLEEMGVLQEVNSLYQLRLTFRHAFGTIYMVSFKTRKMTLSNHLNLQDLVFKPINWFDLFDKLG